VREAVHDVVDAELVGLVRFVEWTERVQLLRPKGGGADVASGTFALTKK
jgi:hypothetical protein